MSNNDDNNTDDTGSQVEQQGAEIMADTDDNNLNTLEGDIFNGDNSTNEMLPVSLESIDSMTEKTTMPAALKPTRKLPLEVMFDVPIELVFEIGRTHISIKQLMELKEFSFVELDQVSVDSVDVRVNEILIAHAETIALQQRYGIRFGELEIYSALENEVIDVTSK